MKEEEKKNSREKMKIVEGKERIKDEYKNKGRKDRKGKKRGRGRN